MIVGNQIEPSSIMFGCCEVAQVLRNGLKIWPLDLAPHDVWNLRREMTTARDSVCGAVVDDRIYVISGITTSTSNLSNANERYDPLTDTWSSAGAHPRPVYASSAAAVDTIIYTGGGRITDSPQTMVYSYDTISGRWTSLNYLYTARSELAAAACNSRVYFGGGRASYGSPYSSIEIFDPQTNTLNNSVSMAIGRRNFAMTSCDGKLYAITGYTSSGGTSLCEVFDELTSTWSYIDFMPISVWDNGVTAVDHKIYSVGGETTSGKTNRLFCYDPSLGVWSELMPMQYARSLRVAFSVGDCVYAIGGSVASGSCAYNEEYVI